MSTPAITSIVFDKPAYHQGDLITATVTYTGNQVTLTLSASGGMVGTTTGTFIVLPNWGATDGTGRVWKLVSDNGSQAVFTATA